MKFIFESSRFLRLPASNIFSKKITERHQAELGQPGIPLFTHLDLPLTNQRIEGPARTENSVKLLLRTILKQQAKAQAMNRNSQLQAQNQAANILFNYTDELSGLGWSIT